MKLEYQKHTYVYYHFFEVNNTLIAANTIDEAIGIWRECNKGKEVKGAHVCRDGDYCLAKIATKEDIEKSFGKEDGE